MKKLENRSDKMKRMMKMTIESILLYLLNLTVGFMDYGDLNNLYVIITIVFVFNFILEKPIQCLLKEKK